MADQPRLVDLVQAVNDSLTNPGIPHAFGGAIALAYYVRDPRATRDLDINISVPVDRAESVFRLLPAAVVWGADDVTECMERGQARLWAGRRREGIPVDLFFPQHRFHAVVADGATERPFLRRDYTLPVISAAHLTVFKVLFNRPKDWVDIVDMLGAGTVDIGEAMYWVRELLGGEHPSFSRLATLAASPRPASRHCDYPPQDLPDVDWASLGAQS